MLVLQNAGRVGLAKFLRALGYLEWYRNINLHLKQPAALAPRESASHFEALKPGIDFLSTKVLDGICFHYKAVSSTLKI